EYDNRYSPLSKLVMQTDTRPPCHNLSFRMRSISLSENKYGRPLDLESLLSLADSLLYKNASAPTVASGNERPLQLGKNLLRMSYASLLGLSRNRGGNLAVRTWWLLKASSASDLSKW